MTDEPQLRAARRFFQRGLSPLLQRHSLSSSPGSETWRENPPRAAEVVELAVSVADARSFPGSNNKIEQTGKRDAVCKSESC